MSEDKTPRFFLEFESFATFSNRTETTFIVTPEWEIQVVEEAYYGEGKVKVLHLVFRKSTPQLGRRIYSLKKEFEQAPGGEVTLDSQTIGEKESVTK
jgi:hypothetical protein